MLDVRVLSAAFLLATGSAWAADPPAPQPSKPGTAEQITVTGSRFKAAPKSQAFAPAPTVMPQNSDAARGFQPSIKPRSYCQSAYQNDVSGQPGNSETQNGRCD